MVHKMMVAFPGPAPGPEPMPMGAAAMRPAMPVIQQAARPVAREVQRQLRRAPKPTKPNARKAAEYGLSTMGVVGGLWLAGTAYATRGRLNDLRKGVKFFRTSPFCKIAEQHKLGVNMSMVNKLLAWRVPTAGFRTLPNVYIAGTQKGGTSSLHKYLTQHPHIHSGLTKETHHFNARSIFGHAFENHPAVNARLYQSFFPTKLTKWYYTHILKQPYHLLEATPSFGGMPWLMNLIKKTNPEMQKVIILLRNPAERTYSAWKMQNRNKGNPDTRTFDEAIRGEKDVCDWEGLLKQCRERVSNAPVIEAGPEKGMPFFFKDYMRRSQYADMLEEIYSYLPKDMVLVLSADELFSDPQATTDKVFDFIGVDRIELKDASAANQAGGKQRKMAYSSLPAETRRFMHESFHDSNTRLANGLFPPAQLWLDQAAEEAKEWAQVDAVAEEVFAQDLTPALTMQSEAAKPALASASC